MPHKWDSGLGCSIALSVLTGCLLFLYFSSCLRTFASCYTYCVSSSQLEPWALKWFNSSLRKEIWERFSLNTSATGPWKKSDEVETFFPYVATLSFKFGLLQSLLVWEAPWNKPYHPEDEIFSSFSNQPSSCRCAESVAPNSQKCWKWTAAIGSYGSPRLLACWLLLVLW